MSARVPASRVRCDCGNERVVSHADLWSGRVTCCGQCGDRIPGHRCGEPEESSGDEHEPLTDEQAAEWLATWTNEELLAEIRARGLEHMIYDAFAGSCYERGIEPPPMSRVRWPGDLTE